MRHLVIIPAYNEEDNLDILISSIVEQTELPTRVVLVDDGSNDSTPQILKRYSEQYTWIKVVTNANKDSRATGAKIVRAFNLGLASEDINQYDILSKFDADLEFPANYFEQIKLSFQLDSIVGLTGGVCTIKENGIWKKESVSKGDHIRGALKSYRIDAFKEMNGLKLFMGWDSADEFILRYHNWKVKPIPNLFVRHHRETNELNGWIKTSRLNAQVFHNLSYGLLIGTLSSLKRGIKYRPFVLSGLLTLLYFFKAYSSPQKDKLDPKIGKFIRSYRRRTILP
jgi:glycosyltransferase involved in cell wall biosynthesis